MSAAVGRNISLTWDDGSPSLTISGVKEKAFTFAGEPIDITSDDDSGWRSLLSTPSEKQVSIKISGVVKDRNLLADWFNGDLVQTITITYDNGATVSGSFYLSEYAETGNYKEALTFEATMMSTGTITYTAGS